MPEEAHAQYLARLARAKETFRQMLHKRTREQWIGDRLYFEALMELPEGGDLESVTRPANVGIRVAAALLDDVEWLRAAPPAPGFQVSAFPDAYRERLRANAQAAAGRARNKQVTARLTHEQPAALAELLNLES